MLISRNLLALKHCAAEGAMRYAMNGIAFSRDAGGNVMACATDGKMLAMVKMRPEALPRFDGAAALAFTEERPGASFLSVLPTMDEMNKKGEVIALGLPSAVAAARKNASKGPNAAALPAKPEMPKMTKLPKRPRSPEVPKAVKLPKRPTDDAGLSMWYAQRAENKLAREARAAAIVKRNEAKLNWLGVVREVKRANKERKVTFKADLSAWKAACKIARKGSDIIALDFSRTNDRGDDIRVRACIPSGTEGAEQFEVKPVEGHYPPVEDVIPKQSAAAFRLVVDARALDALARAFSLIAKAESGELGSAGEDSNMVILTMEGSNARVAFKVKDASKVWDLPESFSLTSIIDPDSVLGSGRVSIGFNPGLLLRLAKATHGSLGSDGCRVEMAIKDEQSAISVQPIKGNGVTPVDVPSGMSVIGVLMPVNLR